MSVHPRRSPSHLQPVSTQLGGPREEANSSQNHAQHEDVVVFFAPSLTPSLHRPCLNFAPCRLTVRSSQGPGRRRLGQSTCLGPVLGPLLAGEARAFWIPPQPLAGFRVSQGTEVPRALSLLKPSRCQEMNSLPSLAGPLCGVIAGRQALSHGPRVALPSALTPSPCHLPSEEREPSADVHHGRLSGGAGAVTKAEEWPTSTPCEELRFPGYDLVAPENHLSHWPLTPSSPR